MKLVHVIPIARSIGKETLSYFSLHDIPEGSIVKVPLRKKVVPALVLSSENVTAAKSKIKRAEFQIKKITTQKPLSLVTPRCISAAKKTAEYFASTTGSVLHALVPSIIIESAKGVRIPEYKAEKSTATVSEKVVLQAPRNDRFSTYRSFIREEFARSASVFLMVPTIAEGVFAEALLQRGINRHTFLFHSSLTKKEIQTRWRDALSAKHPVLIIGTGSFLSIPRNDIKTIIVERENTSVYKQMKRPYIDLRVYAELLAEELHARLVLAGFPLRVETLWRYRESMLDELAPLKLRVPTTVHQAILDMRSQNKNKEVAIEKTFELLSKEIKNIVHSLEQNKERLFIFTARRGLSQTTLCNDCGSTTLCDICKAPIVLHKGTGENFFLCSLCGKARSAKERCSICSSWKLMSLGIGIQGVHEELTKEFPKKTIITINRDSTKTHTQVLKAVEKFYNTPGSILIGTEMALHYLQKPIAHTAVASADSLLLLPEWRIGEKLFSMLLVIRSLATKTFFIQTRKPKFAMLDHVLRGNVGDFYKDEITARKELNYPPFSVLIKCTVIGSPTRITKEMKKLELVFRDYAFHSYQPGVRSTKGGYAMHGLLRVPKESWPDKKLLGLLLALPPHVAVNVDPESLF